MPQGYYYLSEVNKDRKELARCLLNGTNDKGRIIQKEMSKEARQRALALVKYIIYLHDKRSKQCKLTRAQYDLLEGVLQDLHISSKCLQGKSIGPVYHYQKNILFAIHNGLMSSLQRNPIMAIFEDMAEFIGTKFGFLLTFGIIVAGVTAFVVLTQQYNLPAIAGYTFLAAVFGTFFIDMGVSQVYKHYGLFAEKPAPYTVDDLSSRVAFDAVP